MIQKWLTVPPTLRGKERWGYGVYNIAIPLAWSIHVAFTFLFLYWQVPPLALFNMLSVVIWSLAFFTKQRLHLRLTFFMIYFEILAHAILCFLFLGWGFGYQYQIIGVFVAPFLIPLRKRESIFTAVIMAGVTAWAYQYTLTHPPLAQIDPIQLNFLSIINMLAGFVVLIAGMYYIVDIAERAEVNLEIEHRKSETLLNNVLPTAIAARLKQDSTTIADSFSEASVLFADIAGFTPWAQRIPPDRVVSILNDMFSRFDELVDKYHLEKIKTIGDSYMVAGGIPLPRPDHAEAIALFALEMREMLATYNQQLDTKLQLRIGISSGPVVAGVIGKRRFLYDLWGDSVNTASRMESHGAAGEIQISEDTEYLLRGKFSIEERGIVEVKGKGPMKTYWLKGPLIAESAAG
jgi:class 3 adenylate cyclase